MYRPPKNIFHIYATAQHRDEQHHRDVHQIIRNIERLIFLIAKTNHHHHYHQYQAQSWSVAVSTRCFQCSILDPECISMLS